MVDRDLIHNLPVLPIIGIVIIIGIFSIVVVDLYFPVSNIRIDTIVIGKNVFETGGGLAYWLSLRDSNSNNIFLTDIKVDPAIYYSIVIGSHMSLDVRISLILHVTSYKVWSYESTEGHAHPVK